MKTTNPLKIFKKLRWKLTFSYMAASIIAVFTVELIIIALLYHLFFDPNYMPRMVVKDVVAKAEKAGLIMEKDKGRLAVLLVREFESPADGKSGSVSVGVYMYGKNRSEVAIAGMDGKIISGVPEDKVVVGNTIWSLLNPREKMLVQKAFKGDPVSGRSVLVTDTRVDCAVPVRNSRGKQIGVLFVRGDKLFNPSKFAKGMLNMIAVTLGFIALFAGITGIFFGYFSSRTLTRRLDAVGRAAAAWSGGDFSIPISDRGKDELGELSKRLDSMAESLKNLLAVRQQLAAAEERGRLARELHDTVKQKVFAAAMQAAAVRVRAGLDGTRDGNDLAEVEILLIKVQTDLTGIIRELAPQEKEWKPLVKSLGELASEWEIRSGIRVSVQADNIDEPDPLASRTLFLAVSEALANAARHSDAGNVNVRLAASPDGFIEISIADDGHGCDRPPGENAGHGLRIMRERIESLPGGRLDIVTAPGAGFTISAKVFTSVKQDDNEM
jgi:signal transduction histidine kinase